MMAWVTGVVYFLLILSDLITEIVSFPGYYNKEDFSTKDYEDWRQDVDRRLFTSTLLLWTIMVTISTIITVVSIKKIYTTCKTVAQSDESVKISLKSLVIHAILLVIFAMVIIPTNLRLDKKKFAIIWVAINTIDVIIQMIICYICWTMGSSEQLGLYDCFLVKTSSGCHFVRYVLKD